MSDIKFEEIKKDDILLFARVIPNNGYYELHEIQIKVVEDKYIISVEKKTKTRPSFSKKYAEEVLFKDRKLALEYLDEMKIKNKNVKVAEE